MSKGFIVGNGSGDVLYSIPCVYPEGSILTCKDEAETIELKANNTSGLWIFDLPFKGKWTVTSTDPADSTKTKSETVEITKEGESVSVELVYRKYLYKLGNECSDITGGWTGHSSTLTRADKYDTYLYVEGHTKNDGTWGGDFGTNRAIDLTNYTTLCCYATLHRTHNRINGKLVLLASPSTDKYARVADASTNKNDKAHIVTVDISNLTGDYYIFFTAGGEPSAYGCADEIWLE